MWNVCGLLVTPSTGWHAVPSYAWQAVDNADDHAGATCVCCVTHAFRHAPRHMAMMSHFKGATGCVAARSVLAHRLEPLRSLLTSTAGLSDDDVSGLSATELRDALLVLDPLDRGWVARVNQAEAEFWKR